MSNRNIELFNRNKDKFRVYQIYLGTFQSKSFYEEFQNARNEFFKYKSYYENETKDYRKSSEFLTIGKADCKKNSEFLKINNNLFEFIIPNKFIELMSKTKISEDEKTIINQSYIGSSFSWNLNTKLRKGEKLKKEELFIKVILQGVINRNIISENYLCKKYTHYDYIKEVFGINPLQLNDRELEKQLDNHLGEIIEEKGFMSCSMTDNRVLSGECVLNVFVKKGTKAFITDNVKETEIIFDCGTKYIFFQYNVNKNNSTRIILDVLILQVINN